MEEKTPPETTEISTALQQLRAMQAAGPELLLALKDCLRRIPYGQLWDSDGHHQQWYKDARNAISKAESV